MCVHAGDLCLFSAKDFCRLFIKFDSGKVWKRKVTLVCFGHARLCLAWLLKLSALPLRYHLLVHVCAAQMSILKGKDRKKEKR